MGQRGILKGNLKKYISKDNENKTYPKYRNMSEVPKPFLTGKFVALKAVQLEMSKVLKLVM